MRIHAIALLVFLQNARIHIEVRLTDLLAELMDIEWDCICFSETHAADCDYILDGAHRLLCSGQAFEYLGVGILLYRKCSSAVIRFSRISYRCLFSICR